MIRAPEQMACFPSSCSDSDDDLESHQDDEEDEDNDEDYDDEIDETAEKRYLAWASVDNYYPISLFLILLCLRQVNKPEKENYNREILRDLIFVF